MKKLMIAVASVCAAVIANAAVYNWTVDQSWVSADNANPLEVAVYAFDGNANSYSAITAALAGGNLTVLDNAIEGGTGFVDGDGAISLGGSGLTDDGKDPAYARMFALIMDKKTGTFEYFYAYDMGSIKITDGVIADGANFALGDIDNGLITGPVGGDGWTKISTTTTPEPTSGLLLLLGVAGLALRRRRA